MAARTAGAMLAVGGRGRLDLARPYCCRCERISTNRRTYGGAARFWNI